LNCYNHANATALTICTGCSRALCEICAERHAQACGRGYEPAPYWMDRSQTCYNHIFEPGRALCGRCQRPVCRRCGEMLGGQVVCPECRTFDGTERSAGALGQQRYAPMDAGRTEGKASSLAWVVAGGVVLALVAAVAFGTFALPRNVDAQVGASAAASPTDVVQRHYAALQAGDYQTAWQQLSPSSQSQLGYQAWANSYSRTIVQPSGLKILEQSDTSASVAGTIVVIEEGLPPRTGLGRWTLVVVGGTWRLDTMALSGLVSPP
jgi:hypothetical protein